MDDAKSKEIIEALGNLINSSNTLQSIVLGDIGGIEREKVLASFDQSVSQAIEVRRKYFESPEEVAANPTVNQDDPLADLAPDMGCHDYNVAGKV